MVRKIIKIDEEKCNGCGACADACHEGAIVMKTRAIQNRCSSPPESSDGQRVSHSLSMPMACSTSGAGIPPSFMEWKDLTS